MAAPWGGGGENRKFVENLRVAQGGKEREVVTEMDGAQSIRD